MKIKHGMILAAGLGKRMQPITLKTPKPLIQIGKKNLLERAIDLLINNPDKNTIEIVDRTAKDIGKNNIINININKIRGDIFSNALKIIFLFCCIKNKMQPEAISQNLNGIRK